LLLAIAIAALIVVGSSFLAVVILAVDLVFVLYFFVARWARRHYVALEKNSLHLSFGFGPELVIPYEIIMDVRARPAGLFTPQHVALKLRQWRWQFLFPLPLAIPSRRFSVPVGDPEALAEELTLRAAG
jgi:hypothetical protein